MKTYKYFLRMLGFIILASVLSGTASAADNSKSIILYYNGAAQPSTAADPTIAEFKTWCQGRCFRTTQFPLFEPKTGRTIGTAYAWEKDMTFSADYSTMCIGEFVKLKLQSGTLYLEGTPGDSCGTFMSSELVKPISNPQALVAIFSGLGTIVDGTGAYKNTRGVYDVKLKLEVLNNVLTYYDYLFYNITLE